MLWLKVFEFVSPASVIKCQWNVSDAEFFSIKTQKTYDNKFDNEFQRYNQGSAYNTLKCLEKTHLGYKVQFESD